MRPTFNSEKGLAQVKEDLRKARATDPELNARWRRFEKMVGQALAREHLQILAMRAKGGADIATNTASSAN